MTRALLLSVLLATSALAQKSPKQAKTATASAFTRALGKLKLKPIKLATMPADPEDASGDTMFVGNVIDADPTFVVDANQGVYRVVKRMTTIGRVKHGICVRGPAKPIRVKRTRFDVPRGHVFKGDVEVAFEGFVVDEHDTCR
jgi:hypothetical protein